MTSRDIELAFLRKDASTMLKYLQQNSPEDTKLCELVSQIDENKSYPLHMVGVSALLLFFYEVQYAYNMHAPIKSFLVRKDVSARCLILWQQLKRV